MVVIILGIIVVIIATFFLRKDPRLYRYAQTVRVVGLVLIVIGVLTTSIVQIDAGEAGVKKLFGKVQRDVLGSGLHFVNPLMEIIKLDVKTQNYTMSGANDEGQRSGDDAIRVLTADGLEVTIDLSVLYRLNSVDAPVITKTAKELLEGTLAPPRGIRLLGISVSRFNDGTSPEKFDPQLKIEF